MNTKVIELKRVRTRCAGIKDINAICEFELKARLTEPDIWCDEFNEEEYKRRLMRSQIDNLENSKIIIAEKDGKIVGRCDIQVMMSLIDFEKTGYIDWVYVLIDERINGIGKELFEEAEVYFRKVGATRYYAFTASNEEAQKFYHKGDRFEFSKREVAEKELI